MPRLFSITSCFLILSFMAEAQSSDLFDKLVFNDNKNPLPYRLLKPVNPGVKEKFPLVIFLHGAGERGNDNEAQLKHITDLFLDLRNRGKYPCYVLAPQCPKDLWWAEYRGKTGMAPEPTKPMAMVINLIEKIWKSILLTHRAFTSPECRWVVLVHGTCLDVSQTSLLQQYRFAEEVMKVQQLLLNTFRSGLFTVPKMMSYRQTGRVP